MATIDFPGGWGYRLTALAGWTAFLLLLLLSLFGRAGHWPTPILWALAAGPAIIATAQFVVAYRLVARQDEFVRALFGKRMLFAASIAVVLAVGWSSAEIIGAPHLPAWLLYPLTWGLFGVLTPFVQGTQP